MLPSRRLHLVPAPPAFGPERSAVGFVPPPLGVPSPRDPLALMVARGDRGALTRALEELVLGVASAPRTAELLSILITAARGDRGARAILARLREWTGVDLGRTTARLADTFGAFDRAIEKPELDGHEVERLLRGEPELGRALERSLLRETLRAALSGEAPGAVDALAAHCDRAALAARLGELAREGAFGDWVEADPRRVDRAEALALRLQPDDPSILANRRANAAVDAFTAWDRYPYAMIVVPGFTPKDARAAPGVHPDAMERLVRAKEDFDAKKAPFVFLSGGNVHPAGTPYYEALEMKAALVAMGVPEDRIVVDAVARHTTTNLRNAGRYMLAHGLEGRKALITTTPLQDFYLSNPWLSTFHFRAMWELGYRVGRLYDAPSGDDRPDARHAVYEPSRDVLRIAWRDPLDP